MKKAYFLFLVSLTVLIIYAVKVYLKTDYTDFSVYYKAALRFSNQDFSQVYTLKDGASPFRYIPLSLLFFKPFSYFSYETAKMIWYFLQYAFFGLGFIFLYHALKLIKKSYLDPLWVTTLTLCLTLRFCLDTFTIGQISSLMFLGFMMGLYGWMYSKPLIAGLGLAIPTALKIGPGYLFLLLTTFRRSKRLRAFLSPLLVFAFLTLLFLMNYGFSTLSTLFQGWIHIIVNDSSYYDASHYGSQSLKSFLLREVHRGSINLYQATQIQILSTLMICSLVAWTWISRTAQSALGRGYFFSLGIFPYLWFMPETFKYGFTTLAIPIALLLSGIQKNKKNKLAISILTLVALTLSFAGKDLLPDFIFFGMQKFSIPFFSTLALGCVIWIQALSESQKRPILRLHDSVQPWDKIPLPNASLGHKATLLVPIPLSSETDFSPEDAATWTQRADTILSELFQKQYEILLIPYGNLVSEFHPNWCSFLDKIKKCTQMKVISAIPSSSRGSALRTGFLHSQADQIYFAHIEQPCDPKFYIEASRLIEQSYSLVLANRRLNSTRFFIPVRFLSQVYGRHQLGLMFNRLVRLILPISTTDTHSGTLAMSRKLALQVFALQSSTRFLFDLEILLTCQGHDLKQTELPVQLILNQEKKPRKIFSEALHIAYGLPQLAWRSYRGYYRPHPHAGKYQSITADDWGLSPGVNQGILELAQMGIVKRVSLLATSPYLENGLEELKKIKGIELGLHFNLTYETKYRTPSHFLFSWLKHRNKEWLRSELTRQLNLLKKLDIQVAYLDGHHHIHLVPGVLPTLGELLQNARISYVRIPYDFRLWFSTKFPLNLLSILAQPNLKKFGLKTEKCFYPLGADFLDQGKLRRQLLGTQSTEIIVHPAAVDDFKIYQIQDSYTSGRITEFRALKMLSYTEGATP